LLGRNLLAQQNIQLQMFPNVVANVPAVFDIWFNYLDMDGTHFSRGMLIWYSLLKKCQLRPYF